MTLKHTVSFLADRIPSMIPGFIAKTCHRRSVSSLFLFPIRYWAGRRRRPGNRVIDNDIIGVIAGDFGGSEGIYFGQDTGTCLAIGNCIPDTWDGIMMAGRYTKYRDNLTTHVAMPCTGGTDAGNND
jgi:hypothetical protein